MKPRELGISILEYVKNCHLRRVTKRKNKHRFKMLRDNNIPIRKLTSSEKREVKSFFKQYGIKNFSYDTHTLYKSVIGCFVKDVIPEEVFRTYMVTKFNNFEYRHILSDKNYFDMFMSNVKFPTTIVRNIDGNFYDKNYNLIHKEEAYRITRAFSNVVVKPTKESGFGKGVELLKTTGDVFKNRKKDYLVQELVHQHPIFAKLNKSSCNIIRINSVFIDDMVYVLPAAMRVGGEGDFADNISRADGSGMIVIGIDEDGKLKKNGYHSNGTSVDRTPGGVIFEGIKIPQYDKMIEIAKKEHVKFPQIRFIAWDFTVDENDNVVVMEYNTNNPGILYYQYVNGPLFGKYTDVILNYFKK